MNKSIPIKNILFLAGIFFTGILEAQNTYMKFGALLTQFPAESGWKNSYWPGVQIAVAGMTFTQYSGYNQRIVEDTFHRGYKSGGRFWDLGYTWNVQKRIKAPILRNFGLSFGASIGEFRLHGSSGVALSIRPGISLRLFRTLSLYGDVQGGYTFMNHPEFPYMQATYPGAELAFRGFYFAPSLGIRFTSKLSDSKGDDIETADRTSAYHTYERSDGVYDYFSVHYHTGHLTLPSSNNIINFYPKLFLPRPDDIQISDLAGAVGLAFRVGLFALDIEHARGNLGYSNERSGGNQFHWEFNYTSVGFGLNFVSIIKPFDLPSLYRVIVGYKVGVASFLQHYDGWSINHTPGYIMQPINLKNVKQGHWYYSFEIGRFAVSYEIFTINTGGIFKSNVFAASYFFPLYKSNQGS